MMKKVVLIAPANDFAGNTNVTHLTAPIAPPLGILSIGSYLVQHGVPVELIDVQMDFGFGLTLAADQQVCEDVAHYLASQADAIAWVGISQLSNSGSGIRMAQAIHEALPNLPIILGGYFPSNTYQLLLKKFPFITAIVRGDGEVAALYLSHCFAEGRSFFVKDSPNLAWLEAGEIRVTPVRPIILDELPIMDFRLLKHYADYQLIDLVTSRGCPFNCNYCLESSMRPYAVYAPTWVVRQLAHLEAELPNERIFIYDPVFGLGQKRTREICRILGKYRFTYGIESRVDVLSPNQIPALREAGVETIFWGLESASPSTLQRMNKVRSKVKAKSYIKQALEVLKVCFEQGLTPVIPFMLSFPGDIEADYQTSLELVKEVVHLHTQVAAQTGLEPGFAVYSFYTKVYDGSYLAQQIGKDSLQVILRDESFIGERTILSPSPDVDLEITKRYQAQIASQATYTVLALARMAQYYAFSLSDFLAAHPELTDERGVTIFGDSLRRFAQEFNPGSMLLRYYKSKD